MHYLIYATIAIEIIVGILAILGILKFNAKINSLNDAILENRYKIKIKSDEIQKEVYDFCNTIKICGKKVVDKQRDWTMNIVKNFVISLALLLLSKKYKKEVFYVELALIAYQTYKNSIKV